MNPFKQVGATQAVAVTSSNAATAFTNTSASYFLIQSNQVATGGQAFVSIGDATGVVTVTTGIAIHAGTEGLIIKRDSNVDTHIAAIASASFTILITPVQPIK